MWGVGVFFGFGGFENFGGKFLSLGILAPKKKLYCSILVVVYIEPLQIPNKLVALTLLSTKILLF